MGNNATINRLWWLRFAFIVVVDLAAVAGLCLLVNDKENQFSGYWWIVGALWAVQFALGAYGLIRDYFWYTLYARETMAPVYASIVADLPLADSYYGGESYLTYLADDLNQTDEVRIKASYLAGVMGAQSQFPWPIGGRYRQMWEDGIKLHRERNVHLTHK